MSAVRGRIHKFGDNVNTDYIIAAQHKASSLRIDEMAAHAFEDIDSDFVTRVRVGDVIVAGRNFGCGSSREAAVHVVKHHGISCIIAISFARIFFRNAINNGLPVIECDTAGFAHGDELVVDFQVGVVTNETRDTSTQIPPLRGLLHAIGAAGGLVELVRTTGSLSVPGEAEEA